MPRTSSRNKDGAGANPYEVAHLARRLETRGITMIGEWKCPRKLRPSLTSAPQDATMEQWARILDAAASNKQLAIMKVTGNQVKRHDDFLKLLSVYLPRLSVIALNVGEMKMIGANGATPEAYDALERALGDPACIVGHLYWSDPMNKEETKRKERVKDLLTINRHKLGYYEQLVRPDVFPLHGANCWVNFESRHQDRAFKRVSKESQAVSQGEKDALSAQDVVNGEKAIISRVLQQLVQKVERKEKKKVENEEDRIPKRQRGELPPPCDVLPVTDQ